MQPLARQLSTFRRQPKRCWRFAVCPSTSSIGREWTMFGRFDSIDQQLPSLPYCLWSWSFYNKNLIFYTSEYRKPPTARFSLLSCTPLDKQAPSIAFTHVHTNANDTGRPSVLCAVWLHVHFCANSFVSVFFIFWIFVCKNFTNSTCPLAHMFVHTVCCVFIA